MDSFDKWFTRFMFATEIVFLLASMPHIATWFAHFDNPTDGPSTLYAYIIGYALAIAIDGVSFMLLMAVMRMSNSDKPQGFIMLGLIIFMGFIVLFSWWVNWQYDLTYANGEFHKAEAETLFGVSNSALNPIMGGSFQVLLLAYTLIGRAVRGSSQPAMTEAQFQAEKLRIQREQELKTLRKTDTEGGLLATGRERLLGKSKDAKEVRDERLNATVDFLKDAQELLTVEAEPRALTALASLLNLKEKQVLPYLIAARSAISREQAAALLADSQAERDTDEMDALPGESQADILTDSGEPGKQLRGPVYITLDDAARTTGYSREYLQKLVRAGTLGTKRSDKNKLLVSSLNAYLSSHKRTGETGVLPATSRTETGRSNVLEFAQEPANHQQEKTINLGMVESMMVDALQKATPEQQAELRQLASEQSLSEFTVTLQSRYPGYAGYITETRVARVMDAMGLGVTGPVLVAVNS